MRFLSLFSGIGTTELAARELGFEIAAFCEIDPFAQSILEKRFPCVPICTDIRSMKGDEFGAVDVICGGFPCQDLSVAGRKAGLGGGAERPLVRNAPDRQRGSTPLRTC